MLNVPIKPMLLHKSDTPPTGDYIHQLKWDGHRSILSYQKDQGLRLFTRHQNECTRQYPEMQGIYIDAESAVLDGEMVVLDEHNKPCFEYVMQRFQASNQAERLADKLPALFVAFDLLYLDGKDLASMPLTERLEKLAAVVPYTDRIFVCPSVDDGETLFDAAVQMGLEGIVSKRKDSRYQLDTRSHDWLKVKNYQYATVEIAAIRKEPFGWSLAKDGRYVGVTEFVPPVKQDYN